MITNENEWTLCGAIHQFFDRATVNRWKCVRSKNEKVKFIYLDEENVFGLVEIFGSI